MFFSKSKKLIIFSILTYLVVIYFFTKEFKSSLIPSKEYINLYLIYLILLINVTPLVFYCYSDNEKYNLPIFYLSLIYFLFSYTLFFISNSWNIFTDHGLEGHKKAIEVFFLAITFYNFGYYAFYSIIKKNKNSLKLFEIDKDFELLLLGILTVLGVIIFYYVIDLSKFINGIQQIKYPLLYFSYGVLVLYIFNNKEKISLYLKVLLFILILIPIYFDIIAGAFFTPFISLFITLTFYIFLRKKITALNILSMTVLLMIFILIIPIKRDYRNATWKVTKINFIDKTLIYKSELFKNLNKFDFADDFNKRTIRRIFHSYESLIIVSSKTPSEVDFWKGESYKILASKIIPRIFWKNKPSDELGNAFGKRYGAISESDHSTSWNMPVLNEFYVNYGLKGVMIGMFLMGLLFILLSTYFSIQSNNNIEKIVSYYLIIPLFFLESHLSLLFGAVFQSYIFLLIFFILYKKVFKYLKII